MDRACCLDSMAASFRLASASSSWVRISRSMALLISFFLSSSWASFSPSFCWISSSWARFSSMVSAQLTEADSWVPNRRAATRAAHFFIPTASYTSRNFRREILLPRAPIRVPTQTRPPQSQPMVGQLGSMGKKARVP